MRNEDKATIGDVEGRSALYAWFEGSPRSTRRHCESLNFAKAHRVVWSLAETRWSRKSMFRGTSCRRFRRF